MGVLRCLAVSCGVLWESCRCLAVISLTRTYHVHSSFEHLSVIRLSDECFKGRPNIEISIHGENEMSLSKIPCLLLVNSFNQNPLASAVFPPFNFDIDERNVLVNLS